MREVYVYEKHESYYDPILLTDHELTEIERFCHYCEEWDRSIAIVDSFFDLEEIMEEYGITEEGEFAEYYKLLKDEYHRITSIDYEVKPVHKEDLYVGLFFYLEGDFLFCGNRLCNGSEYGDFLIYERSHMDAWENYRYLQYNKKREPIDYDYYPRGRVVYRKSDDTFIIYYDKCIGDDISRITSMYMGYKSRLEFDEHYCCHMCNPFYGYITAW